MRNFLTVLIFILVFHSTMLMAFQPILPKPDDLNMRNVKANFDSIIAKRVTFNNGATSQTIDFPCDTYSVMLATVNTTDTVYIKSAVPIGNQVTVTLSGAASTTLEISLFTILGN